MKFSEKNSDFVHFLTAGGDEIFLLEGSAWRPMWPTCRPKYRKHIICYHSSIITI